jgi:hypothetical protein
MKNRLSLNNIDSYISEMENEKWVDNLLREELPFSLPDDFAGKVANKAVRQFEWKQRLQQFLIFASVIVAGLLIGGLTIYYFADENLQIWTDFLTKNISYLALGVVASIFILFVDKVLLPMFMQPGRGKRNHPVL